MEKTENYGIVYLLTNEAMPGLVKIGKTSHCDLKKRMKEYVEAFNPSDEE